MSEKKFVYVPATLAQVIEGFEDQVKRATAYRVNEHKPGMKVPFHGDFAGANIFTLQRMAWWLRELKAAYERENNASKGTN